MNCRCPAGSSTRGSEAPCSAGTSNGAERNAQNRGSACGEPVLIEAAPRASVDRREAARGCMPALARVLALKRVLIQILIVCGKEKEMRWFVPSSNRLDRGRKRPGKGLGACEVVTSYRINVHGRKISLEFSRQIMHRIL